MLAGFIDWRDAYTASYALGRQFRTCEGLEANVGVRVHEKGYFRVTIEDPTNNNVVILHLQRCCQCLKYLPSKRVPIVDHALFWHTRCPINVSHRHGTAYDLGKCVYNHQQQLGVAQARLHL